MKIPVILGPTAVGKSALTLALAEEVQGELISCDSRQIYTMMDIGTAKPTKDERERVLHHLVDIVNPSVEFSAGEWARMAEDAIEQCLQRGKRPLICGGTFFYFQVLSEGLSLSFPADMSFRKEMTALENEAPGTLHRKLLQLSPEKADKIHANDTYRLIRALQNLRDVSDSATSSGTRVQQYEFVPILLERERSHLYDRINQRVDRMLDAGLYEEFTTLLEKGFHKESPGLKCVGYREFFNYIDLQCTKEFAIEKIKQNTRKFAKRQLTWLRNKIHAELKINLDCHDIDKSIKSINALLES